MTTKVAHDSEVDDLILTPPPPSAKPNRSVSIAINQLNKRRDALLVKRGVIDRELEGIDIAIAALK